MKISSVGKIEDGHIYHEYQAAWTNDLCDFISKNNKKNVEVSVKVVDRAQHGFFKYVWGYLYPDICKAAGEFSIQKMHFELKREFLYTYIDSIDEIPKKHIGKCIIDYAEASGQIVYKGYIKSLSKLTQSEAKQYAMNLEKRLFIDYAGHISDNEAQKYREMMGL
jgi:hypothetical protein